MPNEIVPFDRAAARKKAEGWVNGYTATAIGAVLVTTPVPGGATAVLCTLEATMCYQVGKFYKHNWTAEDGAAAAGVIGIAAFVGQIAAMEAAILTGPLAFAIKPAIAAAIVKSMGQLVIKHFEDSTS